MDLTKSILTLFFILNFTFCKKETYETRHAISEGYSYEYVENDPTQTRIYTLDNGLKIYLSNFENAPRIHVFTAVKAGGKNDPENNSGLAHYLEHMMFKGNKHFGTKDYKTEKILLDSIEQLFNDYSKLTGSEERSSLYQKIDKLSNEAALLAIPNEYDKMISMMGGKRLNAYTTEDRTVYTVDIPSNEIERFLTLEGLRFKQIVNRLFHTELETVYEEKNRTLDSDARKQYWALYQSLFQDHPYGKQSVIGSVKHLKNPSITEIKKYFNNYYRPNNVAICMSGELDFDKTIRLIDKHFGNWEPNLEIPKIDIKKLPEITSPISKEVIGPDRESVWLGFRFNADAKEDILKVYLIDMLLSNRAAGLIDLNLVQKQKVLSALATVIDLNDFYIHNFRANPKEGQSLEELKDLLLGEIENIKKGAFDEDLITAVINDLKKSVMQQDDSEYANYYRANNMVLAFTRDQPWIEHVSYFEKISKITKDELVSFANKHYKENYAVVYKRTGKDPNILKVVKPQITKVPLNRENRSELHEKLSNQEVKKLEPKFLDYKNDLDFYNIGPLEVISKENKDNDLFQLTYLFDFGKNIDPKIELAAGLMNYTGIKDLSAEDLKKEFYNLGSEFSFSTSQDGKETSVTLSGLSENMETSIQLFEKLFEEPSASQDELDKLVERIIKSRSDAKKNKNIILRNQLYAYGKYGKVNPASANLNSKEIKEVQVEELINLIQNLKMYPHRILYYGNKNQNSLSKMIRNYHKIPENFIEKEDVDNFKEIDYEKKYVFWTNFDMVQTEIILLSKLELLDNAKAAAIALFNQYFGGGMNSIVFQEIREAQGLAYSVYSTFSQAKKPDQSDYLYSYVGIQSDKQREALSSMFELINNLPESPQAFEISKKSILNKIESERITKSGVLSSYLNAKDRGIDYDIREKIYNEVKSMNLEKLLEFHEKYIKNKPHNVLLIGNRDNIDFKNLKKYGSVKEISLETLFGY